MARDEGWEEGRPTAVTDQDVAERLVGSMVPPIRLASTAGPIWLDELTADLAVVFVYPHATGLPDAPVATWDSIPGARGCTGQACGFRDHQARLLQLGARVAGLSVQPVREQLAFAERVGIAYPLISDPARELAVTLGLPTFTAEGRTFYRRLAWVAEGSQIVKVFGPITDPEHNATEVLAWLEAKPTR